MAKVYVVQDVKHINILPASVYGKLIRLLSDGQITLSIQPAIHKLTKLLKDFSDEDYLLLVGDPVAIGLATAIAMKSNRGVVNFLKWDRQEKCYYPLKANIERRHYDN